MRTALVTGGNRGIGLQCARRLTQDGAHVILAARDPAALAAAHSELPESESVSLDVTDPAAWEQLADRRIDILVASAGIAEAGPIHRFPVESFRQLLEVNVIGAFLAVRTVLPGMRQRGWGRIIAIASSASHHGIRYGSAYAASKHGLLGLIRSVATEAAGTGVTANSVCPAVVDSQITDRSIARIVATGRTEAEARTELIASLAAPLGRYVDAAEVAAAVAYFAGEDAGAVTGQSLILDGGAVQQ
jgi:NAD(P)-dependent dehydrogenase (short-subunit alcohol dehydrogenase family)